jgi:translation initiation factor 5
VQHLEELRNIQTMASLRPADRIIIFLGSVFTEDAVTANHVELHNEYLKALAPTEIQQRHLIAGFEWLCGSKFPQFNRLFSKVLMQLYEAEVVEEDTFLAWAADTTRNEFTADDSMIEYETLETLRNHAFPFIKWLQEAEEEGDEDDDEEGEEEGDEEADEDDEDA